MSFGWVNRLLSIASQPEVLSVRKVVVYELLSLDGVGWPNSSGA